MSTEVATVDEAQVELTKTRQAELLLSRYENAVHTTRGVTYIELKIPDEDRKILADRATSLQRQLAGCGISKPGRERAAAAIARMFAEGWPLYKFDNPKETVTAYVNAMRDFPAWAIESVCLMASAGRLEGCTSNFPPSAAALVFHLDEKVREMRANKQRYMRVLSIREHRPPAPEMTPEQRDAARARYEDWKRKQPVVETLTQREKQDREDSDFRHRQWQERLVRAGYAAEGISPQYFFDGKPISLELIRNIERGKVASRAADERYKRKLGEGQQT